MKDDLQHVLQFADTAIAVMQVGMLAVLSLDRVIDELSHQNCMVLVEGVVTDGLLGSGKGVVKVWLVGLDGLHLAAIQSDDQDCRTLLDRWLTDRELLKVGI